MKQLQEMNTQEFYTYAKTRIPGGCGLLSKRPESFAPGKWPAYASKSKGCQVWDLDGNMYYDMTTNGIGACILGYADPDVNRAVIDRVENGSMTSLNPPEEVYLAERLCEIHPWAESVRFARTGGETCAIAVRIARATTGRDMVAFCGYHGWTDWYIAANLGGKDHLKGQLLPGLEPAGVPQGLEETAVPFFYNDREGFDQVIAQYGDRLACVFMEPIRGAEPQPDFLQHIREETKKRGILLIFDEITIGWRYCFGGSHLALGVTPDMVTFGKTLGNGHPIGAVVGTREAMDGANRSFISSTFWTECVGPAAALVTLDKIERTRAWEFVTDVGKKVQKDWAEAAARHGVDITCYGLPCLSHFRFNQLANEQKTLYTVLMLQEGFLGGTGFYPTLAHTEDILARHREVIDKVFYQMAQIYKTGGEEAIVAACGGEAEKDFKRLIK